jgi:hypothetical protein
MKPLEQLDNAYKKALHDFESTPSDEQWQRLALSLNRKNNNRRKNLFIISCFLLFGIAAAGLLMFNSSNSKKLSGEIHVTEDQQKKTTVNPNFQQKNRPNIHTQNGIINQSNKIFTQPKINRELGSVQNVEFRKNYKFNDQTAKNASSINNQNEVAGETTITPFDFIDFKAFGIRIKEGVMESVPSTQLLAISTNATPQKDASKTKKPISIDNSGLFITLSGGYGKFDNNILQIENAGKQHKDVQQIFNELSGSYEARQWQAGITYVPKKGPGLALTGGIQYRELNHKFKLNYLYTDIPFKDIDGTILGYVQDTGNIMEFNLSGVNSLKFISLPIYFRAPIWSYKNNELFMGAGMQLQILAGTGGDYFNINNIQVYKTTPSSFRPWSLGYTLGGGYSRNIGKNISMYAEIQHITNVQIQKFEVGDIKSRINGINSQIGIKYKIK